MGLFLRIFIITAVASIALFPFMNGITSTVSRTLRTALPRQLHFFTPSAARPASSVVARHPTTATTASFAPKHQQQTSKMSSSYICADAVLAQIKNRRTHYQLSKDLKDVTPARIQEIVKEATLHVPSSFNSQSNRVVVLFGDDHTKFWDIVTATLKGIVPPESWAHSEQRMNFFQGGAGTILFFEDQSVVEGMQAKFALYADKFPVWSTQSAAMLQYALWVALEAEGLGANLQHYNPIVDDKVLAEWKLPSTWTLNAQLVFGGKTAAAGEKTFLPVDDLVKVYGA